jgi:predicted Rossmann fold flavoprotein
MDLSYLLGRYPLDGMELELNLLHLYEDQVKKWMTKPQSHGMTVRVAIQSVLPPKMAEFILQMAEISPDTPVSQLGKIEVEHLRKLLTSFTLKVTGSRGFDQCQVTAGGVDLKEVNPETMESLLVPGLFFAGEVLDVTGPCGGYNLQFAFSSGAIAGMAAGK